MIHFGFGVDGFWPPTLLWPLPGSVGIPPGSAEWWLEGSSFLASSYELQVCWLQGLLPNFPFWHATTLRVSLEFLGQVWVFRPRWESGITDNWSVWAGFDVDPDRWISNSIRVVEGRRKGFGSSLSNAWGIIKKSFWERVYTWLWRVPIWALSSASSSSNFFSANLEDSSRDTFSARRFSISAIISFELCTILRRRRSSNVGWSWQSECWDQEERKSTRSVWKES